jgi:hypothetical protein
MKILHIKTCKVANVNQGKNALPSPVSNKKSSPILNHTPVNFEQSPTSTSNIGVTLLITVLVNYLCITNSITDIPQWKYSCIGTDAFGAKS